jgi:carboxymethylenebutenolidase
MAQAFVSARIIDEPVRYPGDGVEVPGYLARPIQSPPSGNPAVVVLHEWWGLNDQIRAVTRRFAEAGFVALAPDLYARQGGKATADPQEAGKLMGALSSQWAVRDLNVVIRHLRAQPFVDPVKVGAIGYSMGGILSLILACHNSDIKGAVAFCAKPPPIETYVYTLCPIQFHHAGKDGWVTGKEVDALKAGLEKNGQHGHVHLYPDADHAFYNETRPEVYRAEDARLAWERTLEFLRIHLG